MHVSRERIFKLFVYLESVLLTDPVRRPRLTRSSSATSLIKRPQCLDWMLMIFEDSHSAEGSRAVAVNAHSLGVRNLDPLLYLHIFVRFWYELEACRLVTPIFTSHKVPGDTHGGARLIGC